MEPSCTALGGHLVLGCTARKGTARPQKGEDQATCVHGPQGYGATTCLSALGRSGGWGGIGSFPFVAATFHTHANENKFPPDAPQGAKAKIK